MHGGGEIFECCICIPLKQFELCQLEERKRARRILHTGPLIRRTGIFIRALDFDAGELPVQTRELEPILVIIFVDGHRSEAVLDCLLKRRLELRTRRLVFFICVGEHALQLHEPELHRQAVCTRT